MTPEQEEELLLHVAAGTDPLTALAAVADDNDRRSKRGCGCLVFLAAAAGLTLAGLACV